MRLPLAIVSIEKIKTLNNLKTTKLQPGQKLIIG